MQNCNSLSGEMARGWYWAWHKQRTDINIRENHLNRGTGDKNYLFDHLPEDVVKHMEDVRLGKEEF